MKSKSFDLKQTPEKFNKSLDFVGLYKNYEETSIEPNNKVKKTSSKNSFQTENASVIESKSDKSMSKKKSRNIEESVDITHNTVDGHYLQSSDRKGSPMQDTRLTSTPYAHMKKENKKNSVKSIMKINSIDDTMDSLNLDSSSGKSKKRNKSVSFVLEDNEEVVVKKAKSENNFESLNKKSKSKNSLKAKIIEKKFAKKNNQNYGEEKENDLSNKQSQILTPATKHEKKKNKKNYTVKGQTVDDDLKGSTAVELKKNNEKVATTMQGQPEKIDIKSSNAIQNKDKKKKKKRNYKNLESTNTDPSDEPQTKSRKKEVKPDVIAKDLEHLQIGDNAHTLSNLLDEMTVVEKSKKGKVKNKIKKGKKIQTTITSSLETNDLEKIEEGKEKVIWKKRKWNKDKKGFNDNILSTSVIIENLPIKIMLNFKKLLTEHFSSMGQIKYIGVAEVYPTEDTKPVFTTTIVFNSEGAASKALEDDNTIFEGSRIRVKRPLPPTETTIVVRSYGMLTDQALSTLFAGAGRIRSIKQLIKGKKSACTAFVEFDGPEAVEEAIKLAVDAKIGTKKIHVSRYDLKRTKKPKQNDQVVPKMQDSSASSDESGDEK